MNKKAQVSIFVYFMIGILCFVLGMALAPSLTQVSHESYISMNCSNSTISNQDKANCYQIDTFPPFYIGIIFGLGGIILTRVVT